jgi:hypothetical protein
MPSESLHQRIRTAAIRVWASGTPLAVEAGAAPVLPLTLRIGKPTATALLNDAAALDAALRELLDGERRGRFTIEWRELRFRRSGTQRWPAAVVIHDLDALAAWLGCGSELAHFRRLVALARERLPAALAWLATTPLRALKSVDAFPRMLEVAARLRMSPHPGCYIRELDVAGVDSKFVEIHYATLASLLDTVLPPNAIDSERRASGPAGFARRYGFAFAPARVRLRLLDAALELRPGLSDLELRLDELASWPIACTTVFITENKISGLSFPRVGGAIVLFGMGHALRQLEHVPWLADKAIVYWGDLDTHGFAMLSALRKRFPQTRSLLMNTATLFAHRDWWGQEGSGERWLHALPHLDVHEMDTFEGLKSDRWGEAVRLEQERIGYSYVLAAIAESVS